MSEKRKGEPSTTNAPNMGLAIAMGAGLGVLFGEVVFDRLSISIGSGVELGVSIAIGAGLGIAFGRYYQK